MTIQIPFFHCWESKKKEKKKKKLKTKGQPAFPHFMYYCQSVLWCSLSLIIRCDSMVLLFELLLAASIHASRVFLVISVIVSSYSQYVKWIDNKMKHVLAVIIKLQILNNQFRKLPCLFLASTVFVDLCARCLFRRKGAFLISYLSFWREVVISLKRCIPMHLVFCPKHSRRYCT